MQTTPETAPYEVVNAATGNPLRLAMQELWLTGRILPVGTEPRVRHLFRSGESQPAELLYTFALPRDGALHRLGCGARDFR